VSAVRRTLALVAVLALVLGSAGAPWAEEAGDAHHSAAAEHHDAATAHHDDHAHHAPVLSDLFIPAINFSIYLFIIIRYVIPAMREYLRRRHADIVQAESESAAALVKAEQSLAGSKARLAGLQTEANAIRQDLVAIATRQGERLVAQAEEGGKRRLDDAGLVAEQERRRALADIRAEVAAKATALAEGRIRSALTADDQRTFVQQFLRDAAQ
jgi:F0F1-type ATP synthase membrane subunit b/b'